MLLSTPGSQIATETIVAKKPKSKSSLVGYLLAAKSRLNLPTSKGGIIYSKTNPPRPCEEENSQKKISTKNYKGLKLKTNLKPSENNCYSSPASSISEYKYPLGYDVKQKYASLLSNDTNAGSKMRPKLKAEPKLKEYSEEDDVNNDWCGSQSNLTDIKSQSSSMESLQEVHLKNKQKTDQLALKHKKNIVPKASCVKKKRDLKDLYDTSDSENEKSPKKRRMSKFADPKDPLVNKESTAGKTIQEKSVKKPIKDDYDASDSENDEKTKREKKSSTTESLTVKVDTTDVLGKTIDRGRCTLALDDLGGGDVRVLTAMGGLFYAGSLRAVRAPDVYAVTLDGERGNRPHILSREEALRDAILEVFPASTSELLPGTRLCAYWSQQYRCLYPGTVAEPSTPDPLTDHKFVSVEFDDGDSGRIALEDIRLLQPDYPIVEYDLNPLLTLSKRRRQTSVNSTEDKKGSTFNSSATSTELNTSIHLPPKIGSGLDTFVSTSEQSQLEAEFSHRERKRLKKHKKDKLKKILSRSGDENSNVDDLVRKRKKKHKCCDDHCKHRKHHKKHHRKHKRHHHSSSKEHSGSSSEDPTRSAMLATAFNQSPFFAIKDVSVNLSNSMDATNISATSKSTSDSSEDVSPKVGVTKTIIKKRPIKILKKTLLTKATKMNKGKKITVTDVVEQNGCLEFATNSGTGGSGEHGGVLVKKIKITNTNGKKAEKENLKDSGIGVESNDLVTNDGCEDDEESDSPFNGSSEADAKKVVKKTKKRSSSSTSECGGGSKMAAFLPAGAQLWGWRGPGHRRPQARGRARKCFYRAIQRGTEVINVGDSAVFLSTGRPDRPYIGQVESLWEGWQGGMAVRVRWYYHPEETVGCPGSLASPGGLFESPHTDENDVQTISHRCEVLSLAQYKCRLSTQPQKCDSNDTYYLAGHYDPTHQTLRMEPDIPFVTE